MSARKTQKLRWRGIREFRPRKSEHFEAHKEEHLPALIMMPALSEVLSNFAKQLVDGAGEQKPLEFTAEMVEEAATNDEADEDLTPRTLRDLSTASKMMRNGK